ncbi:MAG: hypothetical protein LBF23_00080, partial [Endomicrobium sp.]|nr:hypothetical protein [Endomicrobium sp.]
MELSLDKFLDDTAKRENITLDHTKTRLASSKFSELIKKLHGSTDICGYTQEELESSFKEYIELAAKNL